MIASLLLKANDVIEVREAKTLGVILDQYLNAKIVLDHVFWKRSFEFWSLNPDEVERMINEVKVKAEP